MKHTRSRMQDKPLRRRESRLVKPDRTVYRERLRWRLAYPVRRRGKRPQRHQIRSDEVPVSARLINESGVQQRCPSVEITVTEKIGVKRGLREVRGRVRKEIAHVGPLSVDPGPLPWSARNAEIREVATMIAGIQQCRGAKTASDRMYLCRRGGHACPSKRRKKHGKENGDNRHHQQGLDEREAPYDLVSSGPFHHDPPAVAGSRDGETGARSIIVASESSPIFLRIPAQCSCVGVAPSRTPRQPHLGELGSVSSHARYTLYTHSNAEAMTTQRDLLRMKTMPSPSPISTAARKQTTASAPRNPSRPDGNPAPTAGIIASGVNAFSTPAHTNTPPRTSEADKTMIEYR